MKTSDELREQYLAFFESRAHARIPSAPLVPENDPTTLFTGSGMQPMIAYLLGESHPKGRRIVDSQRCFRSQDIEEVGDNRHTTYFEMLGNWSLGDYFKKEQLEWFFTFLVDVVGLDSHKLYVTVFGGNRKLGIDRDDESVAVWQSLFGERGIDAKVVANAEKTGMQGGRIFYYPEQKNWWSRSGEPNNMPPGEPGGPDSEVFYDFGAERGYHEASDLAHLPCHVNCDCGRFLEIGNSVFMQFQKQADGSFTPLPQKNVDFGGGLERIMAAIQDDPDVFKIDLLWPSIDALQHVSGRQYDEDAKTQQSFRVIADHVRAAAMLVQDGVIPGNKAQGYFLRRLIRRSVRHGKMLGIERPFLEEIVPVIATAYEHGHPSLFENAEQVTGVIAEEESKFRSTLDRGLKRLQSMKRLTPAQAFELYETHGFPLELSKEVASELRIALEPDTDQFDVAFAEAQAEHAEQSRSASAGTFKGGLQDVSEQTVRFHTATHLLHAALRNVLGSHVSQKGSNITADRLRFDFTHPAALTESEQKQVMELVTSWIKADLPVHRQIMAKSDALDSGAVAFFVEKYPDEVTVYTIGRDPDHDWISKELCGGPHVARTGEIGTLAWKKEQAVAAGVRRVYLTFDTQS